MNWPGGVIAVAGAALALIGGVIAGVYLSPAQDFEIRGRSAVLLVRPSLSID